VIRKRGATGRRLRPESLETTRTRAIRPSANPSKSAFKGFPNELAKNGQSGGGARLEMSNLSTRRHASAVGKVSPRPKAARLVAESASVTREERKEGLVTVPVDGQPKARRPRLHGKAGIEMREPTQATILVRSAGRSAIGNVGGLANDYKAQSRLGQTSALRTRRALAALRPVAKNSGNARNLTRWHTRAGHLGALSEGNEVEHRRSVALKNSSIALRSLGSARSSPRIPERSPSALVVNFSPTVVLKAEPDERAKKSIVEALSRHSHELVQLIEHEMAKQRRVEFTT
jgi:hypothetical protein